MDGRMEFQFAVFKDEDGNYVSVPVLPEKWDTPETLTTPGEIEYILHRVTYDMQSRRLVEEITKANQTDERKETANRINKALRARRAQA
jgi:hypothetical protein